MSWIYGISMHRLQELMRPSLVEDANGNKKYLEPVLKSVFKSTGTCDIPQSETWILARGKARTPKVMHEQVVAEKQGVIAGFQYEPGEFVSTDQFVVAHPGRLFDGYGKEPPEKCCNGGTIFVDAATGLVYPVPQVSLGADETVQAKSLFEEWLFQLSMCEVKHYHSDNGVFTADEFLEDCEAKDQTQSMSGVGA